jgi:hypothetical protein
MIYEKDYIEGVLSRVLPSFKTLGHSKVAEVIHSSGQLTELSKRQLRHYIGEYRETHKSKGNKLIIGDLHAPFILDGYLEHCQNMQRKYECDTVLFAGDITDQHAQSYHESDPDGLSAGDELFYAKRQLVPWFEAFPVADIMMGNHDLIISRKAKSAGLSKHVLKPYGEILGAPSTWTFHYDDIIIDNVVYSHGNVGNATKKTLMNRTSTVQGHLHSQAFVEYSVSIKDALFGMQVGCGIDKDSYAMAYGKPFASKPVISAAVVLDHGSLPIVELMKL